MSYIYIYIYIYIYGAPILDVSRSHNDGPQSYRLWCIVVCDLETSRIYDISSLGVKAGDTTAMT
jgi:hypothetical protein